MQVDPGRILGSMVFLLLLAALTAGCGPNFTSTSSTNATATVNITTAERIGVLLVPAAALSFPGIALQSGELSRSSLSSLSSGIPATATGTRGIVVELRNGKLVPVAITTGLSNGQFTEVLSGLSEGDQVVVSQTGGNTTTPSNG